MKKLLIPGLVILVLALLIWNLVQGNHTKKRVDQFYDLAKQYGEEYQSSTNTRDKDTDAVIKQAHETAKRAAEANAA